MLDDVLKKNIPGMRLPKNLMRFGGKRMEKMHLKLSIIIVNYNTKDLLSACLTSLFAYKKKEDQWEIIVVDNASTDGSLDEVKSQKIHLIANKVNLGFAAANNQGIRYAKGDYILLLNSDTEVRKGTIQTMLMYLESHQSIHVATCRVELPDGSLDPACHRGFPTPWAASTYFFGLERLLPHSKLFSQYHEGYKDMTKEHTVDCISGAFFLIRRKIIEKVGLLDEAFFMYGEDIDWCFRIGQAGYSIGFYPSVSILHRKKQSGRAHEDESIQKRTKLYFYETMKLFYAKHYRHRYGWFVTQLVLLGIYLFSRI